MSGIRLEIDAAFSDKQKFERFEMFWEEIVEERNFAPPALL